MFRVGFARVKISGEDSLTWRSSSGKRSSNRETGIGCSRESGVKIIGVNSLHDDCV